MISFLGLGCCQFHSDGQSITGITSNAINIDRFEQKIENFFGASRFLEMLVVFHVHEFLEEMVSNCVICEMS